MKQNLEVNKMANKEIVRDSSGYVAGAMTAYVEEIKELNKKIVKLKKENKQLKNMVKELEEALASENKLGRE